LPATTFSRTTSSTGARPGLLNDDIGARHAGALVDDVLAEAAQARHGADEADLGERLLDGVLGHAQRGGDGQAADVVLQQRIQQLGHLAAQAFAVTGGSGRLRARGGSPRAAHECQAGDRPHVQKSTCTLNRMNRDSSTAVGVIHFAPFVAGS
jgi:hypothetical protein